jgi:hypothetical protein
LFLRDSILESVQGKLLSLTRSWISGFC